MEQGWIVRVPWGIVPGGEPLQTGGGGAGLSMRILDWHREERVNS